ncbi:hypothetical protein PR202_ga03196 [Eleusine coracana subsp. coracana]|uniref:Uncharacterized protein n=1 Tax=Eleusine coracana subsp. coracana TaxID=191504 RepID=A0AAV5BNG0_ELECO|nr:hypothetical protein PR202_ga03196 [Eleusine coracana subsp. coracana]
MVYYDRVLSQLVFRPHGRIDGWMELKMGEFYNKDVDNGEVCIKLMETSGSKTGLIVRGIEVRPKKGPVARSCAHPPLVSINLSPTRHLERPKSKYSDRLIACFVSPSDEVDKREEKIG